MIVAGLGFRSGATVSSLIEALNLTGFGPRVTDLATLEVKADSSAFLALAKTLDLPVHAVGSDGIAAQETPTRSERVMEIHGTGSIAEAAALAAAGLDARLLSRRVSTPDGMATAAVAESSSR